MASKVSIWKGLISSQTIYSNIPQKSSLPFLVKYCPTLLAIEYIVSTVL